MVNEYQDVEMHSVLVVITNKKRSKFYVQQKDGGHPIPQFRWKYAFFGGSLNKGEEEFTAMKRELYEELDKNAARLISINLEKVVDVDIINIWNEDYRISLYESLLSLKELREISEMPIYEGRRGLIIPRDNLFILPFIGDLNKVISEYSSLKF